MMNRAISYAMKLHSISRARKPVRFVESLMRGLIHAPAISFRKSIWESYCADVVAKSLALHVADKFKENPESFLGPMAIILKSYNGQQKGVVLLKYSYAFPLFIALFDIKKVMERYHIVLEPSWTGYCEGSILCFAGLPWPVFVQSLEPKDSAALTNISKNLIPVEIGANWWIDHRVFRPHPEISKDADICVIASWAKFKRHDEIFDAISKMRRKGKVLRLVLLGYPIDMTKDDIYKIAIDKGVHKQIEMYEKISPAEVAKHISRCKVNLVWSKREGVNKAIIEGFLCGVPGILREGFNYGYKYSYINRETGLFSSPDSLVNKLENMVDSYVRYNPRKWVLENMTCDHAANLLADAIASKCKEKGELFTGPLLTKINALDGMSYFEPEVRDKLHEEYSFLNFCAWKH